jgi:hypothetical protein
MQWHRCRHPPHDKVPPTHIGLKMWMIPSGSMLPGQASQSRTIWARNHREEPNRHQEHGTSPRGFSAVLVVDELERDHGADAERGEEAEQDERAPPAEGIIIIKVVLDKLLYTWARFQRDACAAGVPCAQPGAETYAPSTRGFTVGVDCDCGALCRLCIQRWLRITSRT